MRAIDVNKFTVTEACTIHETIEKIEKLGKGIVCVISEDMVLLGMFTDGDFRRVVMQGIRVEEKLKGHYNTHPYVIQPGMTKKDIRSLYKKQGTNYYAVFQLWMNATDWLILYFLPTIYSITLKQAIPRSIYRR